MNKKQLTWLIPVAALLSAALLSACVPSMDIPQADNGVPAAQLHLSLTGDTAHTKALTGPARSLTPDEADSIVNYYELIVEELDDTTGDGSYAAYERSHNYTRAWRHGSGSLAVNVIEGKKYNILLLTGYLPANSTDPILISSGFGQSGVIKAGINTATVNMNRMTFDMIFWISSVYGGPGSNLSRNSGGILTAYLPTNSEEGSGWYNSGVSPAPSGPYIQAALGGLHALCQAYDPGGDPAHAALPAVAQVIPFFAGEPRLKMGLIVDDTTPAPVLDLPWDKTAYDKTGGGGAGEVPVYFLINPAADLPDNPGDGLLDFEAEYYGFNEAGKGFTKWKIRNGLVNGLDRLGETGGSVLALFGGGSNNGYGGGGGGGNGGGGADGTALPDIELDVRYKYSNAPDVWLIPVNTNFVWSIQQSQPRAASYTLYYKLYASTPAPGSEPDADELKQETPVTISDTGPFTGSISGNPGTVCYAMVVASGSGADDSDRMSGIRTSAIPAGGGISGDGSGNGGTGGPTNGAPGDGVDDSAIESAPLLNMIEVPGSGGPIGSQYDFNAARDTIKTFYIAETEMTYGLWFAVRHWAMNHSSQPYTFTNAGQPGSQGQTGVVPHTINSDNNPMLQPVTNINAYDIMVWCNAFTEMHGDGKPVYWMPDGLTVARNADDLNAAANAGLLPVIKRGGYRIITEAEWEFAARGGVPSANPGDPWNYTWPGNPNLTDLGNNGVYAWYQTDKSNTAGKPDTHNVGTTTNGVLINGKQPPIKDLSGNAYDFVLRISSTSISWHTRGGSAFEYDTGVTIFDEDADIKLSLSSIGSITTQYGSFRLAWSAD